MRHRLEFRRIAARLTLFSLLFMLSAVTYGGQMAVIELMHRPAGEVIPVISPFLGPGDTLSGQDNFLFLSTTPENLTRIQSIVAHLDQVPRQLAITVVQGDNAIDQLSAVDISGSVAIGNGVTVGVGNSRGHPHDSITVDAQTGQRTRRSSDIQQVLVQNGATATIYIGLSVPVAMDRLTHKGMRYHQIQGYREMLTGIQVTPRTSGNRVTLEVEVRQDEPAGDNTGVIRTNHIQTQVQGRMNEWIDIGTILGASDRQDATLIDRSTSRQSSQRHVFVKVTDVNP